MDGSTLEGRSMPDGAPTNSKLTHYRKPGWPLFADRPRNVPFVLGVRPRHAGLSHRTQPPLLPVDEPDNLPPRRLPERKGCRHSSELPRGGRGRAVNHPCHDGKCYRRTQTNTAYGKGLRCCRDSHARRRPIPSADREHPCTLTEPIRVTGTNHYRPITVGWGQVTHCVGPY